MKQSLVQYGAPALALAVLSSEVQAPAPVTCNLVTAERWCSPADHHSLHDERSRLGDQQPVTLNQATDAASASANYSVSVSEAGTATHMMTVAV
jgi:hypothetical protein